MYVYPLSNIMSMKGTPVTDKVYSYILEYFSAEDEFLRTLNSEAQAAGIPAIHISPDQLSFLQVLLKSMNARYVLEVGSLAGYSTIGMARALPEGGKVVAFELNPQHAEFIRRKAAEAGVADKVEVIVGDAKKNLAEYKPNCEFDFVFIDADKSGYVAYLEYTMPMLRVGGLVAGDNALAWGKIADDDAEGNDVRGMQRFNKALAARADLQVAMLPIGDGMAMGVKLY